MGDAGVLKRIISKVLDLRPFRSDSDTDGFSCGDCSRNERCGAEPNSGCVPRAAQMAEQGRPVRKRPALTV